MITKANIPKSLDINQVKCINRQQQLTNIEHLNENSTTKTES